MFCAMIRRGETIQAITGWTYARIKPFFNEEKIVDTLTWQTSPFFRNAFY